MTGWLEYFAGGLATQMVETKERGKKAIQTDILAKKHGLSERQALTLGHVLDHDSITIQGYERLCPNMNRRSLQRDLKAMVSNGLLAERGTSTTDPTKSYQLEEGIL